MRAALMIAFTLSLAALIGGAVASRIRSNAPPSHLAEQDALAGSSMQGVLSNMTSNESAPCGFGRDCPRTYTAWQVQTLTDKMHQGQSAQANSRISDNLHERARGACLRGADVLKTGGWCYKSKAPAKKFNHTDSPFKIPPGHFPFDDGFAAKLASRVFKNGESVTDLGAGVGQAGHSLRWYLPNLQYYGYDGAGNVEEFTKGFVKFVDLSRPMKMHVSDWVISTEVGEHIPNKFEKAFIANIHAHNCKGVVLTWARLGQAGQKHVNCHSDVYLKKLFNELGYEYQGWLTDQLRASATQHKYLRKSALVFKRTTLPSFCAPASR